ncbi:unnamed protein product [Rotaria socialis]|uniref:RING-type domain-containing protein n=1 Tax=Rotaria socialis TaxID=392032 RepID=A0A820HYW5_9BILA|nr:unnamed protein product [Rotaria socialis]CAF3337476.1 unnamed protein product [Rotaria socialis]CAF3368049.1 unnamed protein product [Rotaria socialis]CAF4301118.1 unnamed protein product [Rotaria socialis]CAF4533125.1 unnamed protein product [Rotaria socialis]
MDSAGSYIDRERIVNDDFLIPNEYFCPICQYLLWKPSSCSFCQNLFCHKCIQKWLEVNPTTCPFRCTSFEIKRAPPHIQSIFSRLRVRCCNASFGCTEILPYDLLEQHEQVACIFRTKRCPICEELVLVDQIDEHQSSCKPRFVKCIWCQCVVEQTLLQSHYQVCWQEKLKQILSPPPTTENEANNISATEQTSAAGNRFLSVFDQAVDDIAKPPTICLPGIQRLFESRQHSLLYRLFSMFLLLLRNPKKVPQILFMLCWLGFFSIVPFLIIVTSTRVIERMKTSVYLACAQTLLFSGLLTFGLPVLFQTFHDTTIIIFVSLVCIFYQSAYPFFILDDLERSETPTVLSLYYIGFFVLMKLLLLLIRLYIYCIPPYLTATCLAWTTFFLAFSLRRSLNPVPPVVPVTNDENDHFLDCE